MGVNPSVAHQSGAKEDMYMVQIIADLHLHSKYSRAVSQQMTPTVMAQFGKLKGIDLLATGDWTHPLWFRELKSYLTEAEEGLYKIKDGSRIKSGMTGEDEYKDTRFLLSVEIANIFTQGGKGRRIHNLVFSPSFETSEKINKELVTRGYNITSDGRPIIGLSSKNLLEMILSIDERCLLIPAHIWTPWFGLYGASSGFNSIEESFEDLSRYIYGIETGLSSDPGMNWQVEELNTRSILSFSDAHSPAKMGREATVFELEDLSYENIRQAIMQPSKVKETHSSGSGQVSNKREESVIASEQSERGNLRKEEIASSQAPRNDNKNRIFYTIEFYPEEGKYHYSGHRTCGVTMTPDEQRKTHGICPVCKRHVTDGVMRRVQELADDELRIKNQELRVKTKNNAAGLQWLIDPRGLHPPFVKLVPLNEIISEAIGSPVASPKVKVIYDLLCKKLRSELNVLLKAPIEEIKEIARSVSSGQGVDKVSEGIEKVRKANIVIKPGYDGLYGVVKIWPEDNDKGLMINDKEKSVSNEVSDDPKKQIGLEF